jgi:hypothetical protein
MKEHEVIGTFNVFSIDIIKDFFETGVTLIRITLQELSRHFSKDTMRRKL